MIFIITLRHKTRKSYKISVTVYAEEEQYARQNVLRDYPKYEIEAVN